MFQSARIKLTGWYLLIIMFISFFFSLVIYTGINREFDRIESLQIMRLEQQRRGFDSMFEELRIEREQRGMPVPPPRRYLMAANPEMIQQARARLTTILILINLGILSVAGASGYFLAGKTLKPIKHMVDEQKRFITDASHELRTPLTVMRTEIEVNLRDKGLDLDEARKLLESNLDEVKNLQTLSDGLIKLSQYQKGNNEAYSRELHLPLLIDEAINKVAGLAKQKNITVTISPGDGDLIGVYDGPAIVELFVILLDNAIKYSGEGTEVNLSTKKTDGHIIVEVMDQGIGIAIEDMPHIFGRFYRADKSRGKTGAAGYGLGLSIAKQIVHKHKGSIHVDSNIGKGTTFSVKLPLKHNKTAV